MDVYVQGKKWMWKFAYPGGPSAVDALRVPAGRPVRLLITSRDVIHSFYVPALRVKQDALPGRYTQTWFNADSPGRYEIFCAEYCGLGALGDARRARGDAAGGVRPVGRRSSAAGLAQAQDAAPAAGEAVRPPRASSRRGGGSPAEQGCLKCHSRRRHAAHRPDLGGPLPAAGAAREREERSWRTRRYLTKSMMDPGADIATGFQNVMPTYQGKLAPPEAAAIVEFIKSLKTPAVRTGPSEGPVYESIPRK